MSGGRDDVEAAARARVVAQIIVEGRKKQRSAGEVARAILAALSRTEQPAPERGAKRCPACDATEWFNVYSYCSTDGQGHPFKVYTDSAGDGDRDECIHPWHDVTRRIDRVTPAHKAKFTKVDLPGGA